MKIKKQWKRMMALLTATAMVSCTAGSAAVLAEGSVDGSFYSGYTGTDSSTPPAAGADYADADAYADPDVYTDADAGAGEGGMADGDGAGDAWTDGNGPAGDSSCGDAASGDALPGDQAAGDLPAGDAVIPEADTAGDAAGGAGPAKQIEEPAEAPSVVVTEVETCIPGNDGTTGEELFEKLASRELYGMVGDRTALGSLLDDGNVEVVSEERADSAYRELDGNDLICYEKVSPGIEEIAAGTRGSSMFRLYDSELGLTEEDMTVSAEELGLEEVAVKNEEGKWVVTREAQTALTSYLSPKYSLSLVLLLQNWLARYPYEMYWFDKTQGVVRVREARVRPGGWDAEAGRYTTLTLAQGCSRLYFSVSEDYAVGDKTYTYTSGGIEHTMYIEVDQSDRRALDTAVQTAQDITARYASLGDYDKLEKYQEEICELASYNYDVVSGGNEAYGNPWQLIWVLDGDPETKVVCEGYCKAFLYLCQLSEFEDSELEVLCTKGYLNARRRHMWNVVRLGGPNRYLVDLTNLDSIGTEEAKEKLFMAGAEGNPAEGYTCTLSSSTLKLTYDDATRLVFTEEELTIADFPYLHDHEYGEWYLKSSDPVTRMNTEARACAICGREETRETEFGEHLHLDDDGIWRVYTDGVRNPSYFGLVEYNGGYFLTAWGTLCSDANGLNLYDGKWYFLAGGQVQYGYDGFALYDGHWFIIRNGLLDTGANGLFEYNGGQFLFAAGKLRDDVSGLWQGSDGHWYFLANGQVQTQYTGWVVYDGARFYVEKGILVR